jgi:hypothetical protein
MFTQDDFRQIADRGSSVEAAESQVLRFKKGFPWMDIVAPATPERGIEVLDEEEIQDVIDYIDETSVSGMCKFVPASGAASRMFKDIFAGLAVLESGQDLPADAAASKLAAAVDRFAFYTEELFGKVEDSREYRLAVTEKVLTDKGLGYGSKPKGVIRFHKYPGEARTAFAEHLVEGQDYMRGEDGTVHLTVTISPEHRPLFEAALEEVRAAYEERYGVKYDVRFTYQDKATDTIAVDKDNKPFRKEDGSLLFRPAGHGALIYNLNEVKEEIVSIKNIDNVAVERLLPLTSKYKKALIGRALQLRDTIFGFLVEMDMITGEGLGQYSVPVPPVLSGLMPVPEDRYATNECQMLCNEIEEFLREELCIEMPEAKDCKSRAQALKAKLNRPIRVCGMVRNQGEPGGGPFIIRAKDGSTSLQILESVQIDKENPEAVAALKNATHFNPVDLVCCLQDYRGEKFNLPDYVDEDAGFISSKSYQGRELKALELPGLWNGSMSDWNTLFVEVPVETFNPVKVVLDLLRPAHQA